MSLLRICRWLFYYNNYIYKILRKCLLFFMILTYQTSLQKSLKHLMKNDPLKRFCLSQISTQRPYWPTFHCHPLSRSPKIQPWGCRCFRCPTVTLTRQIRMSSSPRSLHLPAEVFSQWIQQVRNLKSKQLEMHFCT